MMYYNVCNYLRPSARELWLHMPGWQHCATTSNSNLRRFLQHTFQRLRRVSLTMQVAKLRNSVKEALIVQQDCEAHKVALNAVGQMLLTSGPDLETTDFKQLLSVKRQLILDDLGCAAHYYVMLYTGYQGTCLHAMCFAACVYNMWPGIRLTYLCPTTLVQ